MTIKNNHKRIYEDIVEQIKDLIEKKELSPGDRLLSERELAKKFKVSRTAVREAHKVLAAEGYVEVRPGGGVFVTSVDNAKITQIFADILFKEKEEVVHILEVRKVLESFAVKTAVMRATEVDLLRIRKSAHEAYDDILATKMANSDIEFHANIAKATHNPILIRLNEVLVKTTRNVYFRPVRRQVLKTDQRRKIIAQQHIDIYEAIKNKDAERAEQLIAQHIEMSAESLFEELS